MKDSCRRAEPLPAASGAGKQVRHFSHRATPPAAGRGTSGHEDERTHTALPCASSASTLQPGEMGTDCWLLKSSGLRRRPKSEGRIGTGTLKLRGRGHPRMKALGGRGVRGLPRPAVPLDEDG